MNEIATDSQPKTNKRKKRALISLLVLGALTTIVGVSTLADFTAGSNYTGNSFATAKLQINNNNVNDAASINLSLASMLPGDSITKTLDVVNTGDTDVVSYSLATVATTSTALDTGASSPLKVWVARCSVAWLAGACGGTTTNLAGSTAGAPNNVVFASSQLGTGIFCKAGYAQHAIRGVGACDITDTDHLQFRVSMTSTGAAGAGADNSLQNLTSVIKLAFSGQQPAAHNF